jgi:DNA-binding NtrC family response regulator
VLLLTDVIMPGMDGKALSKQAKSLRPELKTLFMSGYTDNILDANDKTDSNFIQKPFSVAELSNKIKILLQGEDICAK